MRSVANNNHLKTKQAIDMNTITSKIITILLLLFTLSACGSDKKQKDEKQQVSEEEQQVSEEDLPFVDPSVVAEEFFLNIYMGDQMEVKQHCTNKFWEQIRAQRIMQEVNKSLSYAAQYYGASYKIYNTGDISRIVSMSDQVIEGNLARVNCTIDAPVGAFTPETATLFMIIKDGEWMIEDMSQFIPVGDRIQ